MLFPVFRLKDPMAQLRPVHILLRDRALDRHCRRDINSIPVMHCFQVEFWNCTVSAMESHLEGR